MEDSQLIAAYSKTLKSLREKKSISQEKLAFKAGLHPTYISLLERQKRQPSLVVIFKIALELGYQPSEFIHLVESEIKQL